MNIKKRTGAKKPEIMIYIGPTITGVAAHNTFLNNGITDSIRKAMDKEPAFKNLVIPAENLAAAASDLREKRGAIYEFYKKAVAYRAD